MLKAREPLRQAWDAIHALESGERPLENHWTTAIVALRAVGHALIDDAKKSPTSELIIGQHWEQWKKPGTWFTDFIEPMRNELLKEWKGFPDIAFNTYGDYDEIVDVRITLSDGDDGLYCLNEAAQWLSDELDEIEIEINLT